MSIYRLSREVRFTEARHVLLYRLENGLETMPWTLEEPAPREGWTYDWLEAVQVKAVWSDTGHAVASGAWHDLWDFEADSGMGEIEAAAERLLLKRIDRSIRDHEVRATDKISVWTVIPAPNGTEVIELFNEATHQFLSSSVHPEGTVTEWCQLVGIEMIKLGHDNGWVLSPRDDVQEAMIRLRFFVGR
jgi:hypothetical protein